MLSAWCMFCTNSLNDKTSCCLQRSLSASHNKQQLCTPIHTALKNWPFSLRILSIYCKVGVEFLHIPKVNFRLQVPSLDPAFRRWLFIVNVPGSFWGSSLEIFGGHSGSERSFCMNTLVFSCHCHSTIAPYPSLSHKYS